MNLRQRKKMGFLANDRDDSQVAERRSGGGLGDVAVLDDCRHPREYVLADNSRTLSGRRDGLAGKWDQRFLSVLIRDLRIEKSWQSQEMRMLLESTRKHENLVLVSFEQDHVGESFLNLVG
jgi:hypothetical protein